MVSKIVLHEKETAPDITQYPWFAVRVRSNHERIAAAHLRERGYEEFSPSWKTERRWSDRTKEMDQFLFPGYVFCRLNPLDRLPVLTAPGVVDLVGFGKIPAPVPDQEIENCPADGTIRIVRDAVAIFGVGSPGVDRTWTVGRGGGNFG